MFRLFIFVLLVFLVILLINYIVFGGRKRRTSQQGPSGSGEEMVLDPQCQSYIPKTDALQRNGHYFCSEECASAFLSG